MKNRVVDRLAQGQAEQAGVWCMRLSEGQLDAEGRAAFEAWLAEDPHHRAAFEQAVALWRDVGAVESTPEFLPLRVQALNDMRRVQRRRWSWGRRPWVRSVAVAAGLLLVAVGILWRLHAPDVYQTAVGERRVLTLVDGSRLSLDADTRVEVRYRDSHRDLRLRRGRAHFTVAKDPLRPFSVTAGNRIVVATGTAFSVELLNERVHVVLYEGSVSVNDHAGGRDRVQPLRLPGREVPADTLLTPGHELVAALERPVATVAPTDPLRMRSWESGQLVFVDEPLAAAVERVNRYAMRRIEVGDAAVGRVRINGVFDAGDMNGFLEGVVAVFPVRVDARDGRLLLRSID